MAEDIRDVQGPINGSALPRPTSFGHVEWCFVTVTFFARLALERKGGRVIVGQDAGSDGRTLSGIIVLRHAWPVAHSGFDYVITKLTVGTNRLLGPLHVSSNGTLQALAALICPMFLQPEYDRIIFRIHE